MCRPGIGNGQVCSWRFAVGELDDEGIHEDADSGAQDGAEGKVGEHGFSLRCGCR